MSSSSSLSSYQLPVLAYGYTDLAPVLSEAQLRLHHQKHTQTYTDKLNAALTTLYNRDEAGKALATSSSDALFTKLSQIPTDLRKAITNNLGGYVNHDLYFKCLTGAFLKSGQSGIPKPSGDLLAAIAAQFGSFEAFVETFGDTALNVFGSGWAWLIVDAHGKLAITTTANQDHVLTADANNFPLLILDVWEHAYYKDYENRRAEYIKNIWQIVNWDYVQQRFHSWKGSKHSSL